MELLSAFGMGANFKLPMLRLFVVDEFEILNYVDLIQLDCTALHCTALHCTALRIALAL